MDYLLVRHRIGEEAATLGNAPVVAGGGRRGVVGHVVVIVVVVQVDVVLGAHDVLLHANAVDVGRVGAVGNLLRAAEAVDDGREGESGDDQHGDDHRRDQQQLVRAAAARGRREFPRLRGLRFRRCLDSGKGYLRYGESDVRLRVSARLIGSTLGVEGHFFRWP